MVYRNIQKCMLGNEIDESRLKVLEKRIQKWIWGVTYSIKRRNSTNDIEVGL